LTLLLLTVSVHAFAVAVQANGKILDAGDSYSSHDNLG